MKMSKYRKKLKEIVVISHVTIYNLDSTINIFTVLVSSG